MAASAADLDDDAREALADLLTMIADGMVARDAVAVVMEKFGEAMAQTLARALAAVTGEAKDAAAAQALQVGRVTLSARMYLEAAETGEVVQGIVNRHLQGYADARALARELYEGYTFRAPDAEPLQMSPRNDRLPRYLRDVLRTEPGVERAMAARFAQIQVNGLATPALRAAYSELLDAISWAEQGPGAKALENRLRVAFYERTRYFAQRIAQTEIHRAFNLRQAAELMADADVEFVQIRRAPGRGAPCICTLYTGRDVYGLGAGVYPKGKAPLSPYHPFCRCVVSPRLDLTGKRTKAADPDADAYFLRRLGQPIAARVVGSRAKLEQVLSGRSADEVYALGKAVQIQTVAEAAQ